MQQIQERKSQHHHHYINKTFKNENDLVNENLNLETYVPLNSSNSSSSSSYNYAKKNLIQSKFQQIINLSLKKNSQQKIKCKCKTNQKQFDCVVCTQFYPVNVRRSMDGEETNYTHYINHKNAQNTCLDRTNLALNEHNQSISHSSTSAIMNNKTEKAENFSHLENSSVGSAASDLSTHNYEAKVILKPSPIPISSTLMSLLAMTKPNNMFIPPPNVSISITQSQQFKNKNNF
jgi:hypothetical protein